MVISMIDMALLERLCLAYGPSGDEDEVRGIIINEIRDYADSIETDGAGNIIVFRKGRRTPEKTLLLAAHTDEVGFMVSEVTGDGYLKFLPVGGIDPSVAAGKAVRVGAGRVRGVIGSKPIHLLGKGERSKVRSLESMYIDTGVVKKEKEKGKGEEKDKEKDGETSGKAENPLFSIGDTAVFDSPFMRFGEGGRQIKCKALDDRFGCLVLIGLIRSELEYDTWFAFTACEEIGMRGAYAAAYKIRADISVVIEATTAGDIYAERGRYGAATRNKVCTLGGGAVLSLMDNSAIYDREYVSALYEHAKKCGINVQYKQLVAGGNDSGALQTAAEGTHTIALSLPARYLHSPSVVVNESDMEAVISLSAEICSRSFII